MLLRCTFEVFENWKNGNWHYFLIVVFSTTTLCIYDWCSHAESKISVGSALMLSTLGFYLVLCLSGSREANGPEENDCWIRNIRCCVERAINCGVKKWMSPLAYRISDYIYKVFVYNPLFQALGRNKTRVAEFLGHDGMDESKEVQWLDALVFAAVQVLGISSFSKVTLCIWYWQQFGRYLIVVPG